MKLFTGDDGMPPSVTAERERADLLESFARVLSGVSHDQMHNAVTNMRNAMAASLPGAVSVAEAAGVTIAAAAELASIFLEQVGNASDEAAEGHRRACVETFERVMVSRRAALNIPAAVRELMLKN